MARHLPAIAALKTKAAGSGAAGNFVRHIEERGEWLYEKALALELEGIVGKRLGSLYTPGVR